jgi:hypothetical protein
VTEERTLIEGQIVAGVVTARYAVSFVAQHVSVTAAYPLAEVFFPDSVFPDSVRIFRQGRVTEGPVERATGIDPASPVWKTGALPLSYARVLCLVLNGGPVNGRRCEALA